MVDRDAILARVRAVTLIEDTNVSDATIVLMINEGMHEISLASEWPWLEESTTISAVANQQGYNLPGDFNYAVAVVDDDNDLTVPYISPSDFFHRYGNDTGNTGTTPNYFTIWDGQILFTPTPSANDTNRFTLYYLKTVTTLSSGSSVPAFHAAFHPMLVEYCKWKLYDREEYFDQSERAFITYARYLSQMITWYSRRAKREPYIGGDGDAYRSPRDPNIPFLRWQ
jgi:hypothetical protein